MVDKTSKISRRRCVKYNNARKVRSAGSLQNTCVQTETSLVKRGMYCVQNQEGVSTTA